MDKYLLEILKQVSTIIIPGLGALTITNQKTGEIMFMPYLKHDDGKLSAHISEKEGWDENEAKNLIAKYVREIQAELDKGEEYTMYQFGSFVKVGGDIEFENWGQNTDTSAHFDKLSRVSSATVENEYIPPVEKPKTVKKPSKENPKVVKLAEEPVKEKKVVKKATSTNEASKVEKSATAKKVKSIVPLVKEEVEDVSKTPVKELNILEKEEQKATADKLDSLKKTQEKKGVKKKKSTGFWVGIVLLAILVSGGTYVGLNYDDLKQKIPFLADNSSDISEQEDQNSEVIDENILEEETFDTAENVEDSEEILEEELVEILTNEAIDEQIIEEIPIEQAEVVTESTDYSSELPYQIIAGAFSNEANATRLVEKLKSEGYPALQKRKGSTYMVSVKSFATRADAQAELSAIKEVASGGWITKW
ncbi:MAG: SPOR domain-containing protein [Fluviicola sp.]|nr:SPOR domain-containing protein [Fluviicola sp.]